MRIYKSDNDYDVYYSKDLDTWNYTNSTDITLVVSYDRFGQFKMNEIFLIVKLPKELNTLSLRTGHVRIIFVDIFVRLS